MIFHSFFPFDTSEQRNSSGDEFSPRTERPQSAILLSTYHLSRVTLIFYLDKHLTGVNSSLSPDNLFHDHCHKEFSYRKHSHLGFPQTEIVAASRVK